MQSDWIETYLGNEIELLYGKALPKSSRLEGEYPVFGSNGIVGFHNEALVNGPGIIVGRKGSCGAVHFSTSGFWPIDTTYYIALRKNHNWRFMAFFLSTFELGEMNSHSTIPGLNREDVYKLKCYIPPLPEQQKIAAVLFKIQKAIEIQEAIIEKMRELKRSTLHHVFTHGLRGEKLKETEIGLMPESWRVREIGSVLKLIQYGLSVRGLPKGQYPILRMNCQVDGRVHLNDLQYVDIDRETFEKFKMDDGDILFNRTNSWELVGRTAIYHSKEPAVFASYLIRMKADDSEINPDFVNFYFNVNGTQKRLKSLASRGVSQSNISASKLKTFQIPAPGLKEQLEIVKVLQTIDQKIELHTAKKSSLQDLFKTMLNKLMTGEIRVKDLDIDTSEVSS